MLAASNAVAAVIRLADGRYLMQLRDERPDIWYPGHWGCFGGAVDGGEDPLEALRRELYEELEFVPRAPRYLTRFDFDFAPIGLAPCYRIYYLVAMSEAERARLVLHEGRALEAFGYAELAGGIRVTPYDAFAVRLLELRDGRG
jgi:8-oxo-dGTP pyrophosphatase MutT (NUDIX family)